MSSPLLPVHVFVALRGPSYIALCLELGVAACGATADEAVCQLEEAVREYVQSKAALGLDVTEEYEPLSPEALAEYRREVITAGAQMIDYQLLPPDPRCTRVG